MKSCSRNILCVESKQQLEPNNADSKQPHTYEFVCLFGFFRPTREFFSRNEKSLLLVKGSTF